MDGRGKWSVMGAIGLAAILCGCDKAKEAETAVETGPAEQAQAPSPNEEAYMVLMQDVDRHVAGGRTNAVIARLQEGLADPVLSDYRDDIYLRLVGQMIRADRAEDAGDMVREQMTKNASLAGRAAGMLHEHWSQAGRYDLIEAWTDGLLAGEVPARLTMNLAAWRLRALLLQDKLDALAEGIRESRNAFGDAGCARIAGYLVQTALRERRLDAVNRILSEVDAFDERDANLESFLVMTRLRLLQQQGDWDKVADYVIAQSGDVEASVAQDLAATAMRGALRAGAAAAVDRMAAHLLESNPVDSELAASAARQWVAVAAEQDQPAEIMRRIESLQERGLPDTVLCRIVQRRFYKVIGGVEGDVRTRLLALTRQLAGSMEDADLRENLQSLIMDGAVINEDFELALDVLDAGFRADEPDWHAMAKNKIQAHLALKEERYADAIERFRAFMQHASSWESATADPTTGIRHTREMMLGRNAKRIAEIYATMGKPREARKAYAEARTYYEKALAEVESDSKAAALIETEIEDIPGMAPGKGGDAEK